MAVLNPQAKTVREHISRAKGYLGRSEMLKGMRALIEALKIITTTQIFGRDKFEIETLAREVVANLNQYPDIKKRALGGIPYKKGGEKQILLILETLAKVIQEEQEQEQLGEAKMAERRKEMAFQKARDMLVAKDFMGAIKVFRSLSEIYPRDATVSTEIGEMILENGYPKEAVEFLEAAIEYDPKAAKAYASLVTAYRGVGEIRQAERVYLNAIKQFGSHPRTFLNLAKLYMEGRDWDKAYEAARKALSLDSGLTEAKDIVAKLESKFY